MNKQVTAPGGWPAALDSNLEALLLLVDWWFGERKIVLQVMLNLNPGWIVGRR